MHSDTKLWAYNKFIYSTTWHNTVYTGCCICSQWTVFSIWVNRPRCAFSLELIFFPTSDLNVFIVLETILSRAACSSDEDRPSKPSTVLTMFTLEGAVGSPCSSTAVESTSPSSYRKRSTNSSVKIWYTGIHTHVLVLARLINFHFISG